MKSKRIIILVLTVVLLSATIAPAALAAYAPTSWSSWSQQRRYKNGSPSQGAGYSTTYCFAIQRFIRVRTSSTTLSVDGLWGDATEYAVEQYQKAEGLTADKIVGTGTWGKMYSRLKKGTEVYDQGADDYFTAYNVIRQSDGVAVSSTFRYQKLIPQRNWHVYSNSGWSHIYD